MAFRTGAAGTGRCFSLESDLSQAGSLLVSGPLTVAGRYRLTLRARTERLGPNTLALMAWKGKADGAIGEVIASTAMNGTLYAAPMQWHAFTLDFDVEYGQSIVCGVVLTSRDGNHSGSVQFERASLALEKLPTPLFISYAFSRKIRYKHAEQGAVDIRLTNTSALEQRLQVCPLVSDENGLLHRGTPLTFTVSAASTLPGVVPFTLARQDGGYEVFVEARQGRTLLDTRSGDVFAVSDSPFAFALQPDLWVPNLLSWAGPLDHFKQVMTTGWAQYVEECRACVAKARRNDYCTYTEDFAWAKEDATILDTDSDEPYLAGQCSWPVSRKQLVMLNQLLREQGIAPAAYLDAAAFGWPGFDVLRENPEWYEGANFNVESWEKYLRDDQSAGAVYPWIPFNFAAHSSTAGQNFLDYHIAQLKKSAQTFGWEAYRYDAGPLPPAYFATVKHALAHLQPPVAIGNNMGVLVLGNQQSDGWKTYASDGSWMMEEVVREAFNTPANPQRNWDAWMALLKRGAYLTRLNRGIYTYINSGGNWLSAAVGFAAGGHPWSTFTSPYANYNRFMLRYGHYFWDRRTQFLDSPERSIQVSSPKALWWQALASVRQLGGSHRQLIIPLFNPPMGKEVVDITADGPADGVRVKYTPRPGEKVTAFVLAPEPVAQRITSTAQVQADGSITVTVPRFWGWSNVVFDCR